MVSMRFRFSRSCKCSKRMHHLPLLGRHPGSSNLLEFVPEIGLKEVTMGSGVCCRKFKADKLSSNNEYQNVNLLKTQDKHVGPISSKLCGMNPLPALNLYSVHPSFLPFSLHSYPLPRRIFIWFSVKHSWTRPPAAQPDSNASNKSEVTSAEASSILRRRWAVHINWLM